VQAYDTPHLAATAQDLPSTFAGLTLHTSRRYPSVLTIPGLGG
jgi:hypothetical protein